MRKITANVLYILLIVMVLFSMGYILFYMKSEGGLCLRNPYVYGASRMGDIECSCVQKRGDCEPKFTFNDTSFDSPVTVCPLGQIKNKSYEIPINISQYIK